MNKVVKIVLIFIMVDIVIIGGYFGYKAIFSDGSISQEYDWVRMDAYYSPQDYIEEFIMKDSAAKDLFPVFIKNYQKDKKMLRKFRGKNFAGPNESTLRMKYRDMEDWQLVELKYKEKNEREITRAILYIHEDGVWKVGDSGKLIN